MSILHALARPLAPPLALLALLLPACGAGTTTIVSLKGIRCASCGATAVKALEARDGIFEVRFDRGAAELTVRHDPTRAPTSSLLAWIREAGFTGVLGAGRGSYLAAPDYPAGLDVAILSPDGRLVDLEAHRVEGKVTVFDYFARWCAPCRQVDRMLIDLLQQRPDVAVRKLDVVDWDSPIARRHLDGVPELPYVVVYGRNGARVDAISGLHLDRLRDAIERGAKP